MYVLVCQSGSSKWRVEFEVKLGQLTALSNATTHAARVLLSFEAIEVTLYGHGVCERYTKKHIARLLDAVDAKQLPYTTPDPHQEQ